RISLIDHLVADDIQLRQGVRYGNVETLDVDTAVVVDDGDGHRVNAVVGIGMSSIERGGGWRLVCVADLIDGRGSMELVRAISPVDDVGKRLDARAPRPVGIVEAWVADHADIGNLKRRTLGYSSVASHLQGGSDVSHHNFE